MVLLQDYLARLQAIRQQNYLERKRIQQRMQLYRPDPPQPEAPPKTRVVGGPPQINLEERRRKIAALKVRGRSVVLTLALSPSLIELYMYYMYMYIYIHVGSS